MIVCMNDTFKVYAARKGKKWQLEGKLAENKTYKEFLKIEEMTCL